MNPFSYCIFIILLLIDSANAQSIFQTTISDGADSIEFAYSVQQTADEGFILAGGTYSIGAGDVYLIRTDADGSTLWAKTYGGGNADIAYSVRQTADGGFIVTGITESFGAGDLDVYLIKTDSMGDTLWTKTYGGSSEDFGHSVIQTADGGYVVTGSTYSFGAGINDIYLIRTDSVGDTIWTKTYGGVSSELGFSVQQTNDGGYILSGQTMSFSAGLSDIYLVKTSATGNVQWTKSYGGSDLDWGYSVKQTTDNGYIIGGYTRSFGPAFQSIYLIKTDSVGDTLWTRTYGGNSSEYAYSVHQTADGGYVIGGFTDSFGPSVSNFYLMKTDVNGDTLWTKAYGGGFENYAYCVELTNDGGYVLAGLTKESVSASSDVYLIKTDAQGNSGCNQQDVFPMIETPATLVSSGSNTGSGGIIGNTATLLTNRIILDSSLCTNTGMNKLQISNNNFSIFPNPATDKFFIKGTLQLPALIELFDLTGRRILHQIIKSGGQPVSVKDIGKGYYLCRVSYEDTGDIVTGKIIVK